MSEVILNAENWQFEANAVINDIKEHVKKIELASTLSQTDQEIYLNLTTKEDTDYCIELSGLGFRVVGHNYDIKTLDNARWYETPYSLLNDISPLFQESFGNALMNRLHNLNK